MFSRVTLTFYEISVGYSRGCGEIWIAHIYPCAARVDATDTCQRTSLQGHPDSPQQSGESSIMPNLGITTSTQHVTGDFWGNTLVVTLVRIHPVGKQEEIAQV